MVSFKAFFGLALLFTLSGAAPVDMPSTNKGTQFCIHPDTFQATSPDAYDKLLAVLDGVPCPNKAPFQGWPAGEKYCLPANGDVWMAVKQNDMDKYFSEEMVVVVTVPKYAQIAANAIKGINTGAFGALAPAKAAQAVA